MREPLWEPNDERIAAARLTAFIDHVNTELDLAIDGYPALYDWSISERGAFWGAVWNFGGVIAETRGEVTLADADKMPGARFFPDARLNFAENLLRNASALEPPSASDGSARADDDALVFWGEDTIR